MSERTDAEILLDQTPTPWKVGPVGEIQGYPDSLGIYPVSAEEGVRGHVVCIIAPLSSVSDVDRDNARRIVASVNVLATLAVEAIEAHHPMDFNAWKAVIARVGELEEEAKRREQMLADVVKESNRRDQKWMDGIDEVVGQKLHYDLGIPCASKTLGDLVKGLHSERDNWKQAHADAFRALKLLNDDAEKEIAEYQSPREVQTVLGQNGYEHVVNGWEVPAPDQALPQTNVQL